MLTCISTAHARTKCVTAFWAHSGLRHFTCKFPYKVASVKLTSISTAQARTNCVSTLQVQSGISVARHFTYFTSKFPYKTKWLLWNVALHFDCAGSHKVCVRVLVFPLNFRTKWLLWNVDLHFDCSGSHKVCVCVLGSIRGAAFF